MIKKMTCPRCAGDGKIELPSELKVALRYVARENPATAKGLHKECGGTRSSANHKLDRLHTEGLVSRKLVSREYHYFINE